MPDADFEMTTRILADSGFGCAGQRCLAAAVAITVGEAKPLSPSSWWKRPAPARWVTGWTREWRWDR